MPSRSDDHVANTITSLLRERGEESDVMAEVIEVVYQRLHKLAGLAMRGQSARDILQTTVLANEAAMRLLKATPAFRDRSHLFATASLMMQQILVDHARNRRALRRGGDRQRVPLDDALAVVERRSGRIEDLHEALALLESEDPKSADFVRLRFLLGLTVAQASKTLGISERSGTRIWEHARAWLAKELRS